MQHKGIYGDKNDLRLATGIRKRMIRLMSHQQFSENSLLNRMKNRIESKISTTFIASWFIKYDRHIIECSSVLNFMLRVYRTERWNVPKA